VLAADQRGLVASGTGPTKWLGRGLADPRATRPLIPKCAEQVTVTFPGALDGDPSRSVGLLRGALLLEGILFDEFAPLTAVSVARQR
jgi:hypothetical protein